MQILLLIAIFVPAVRAENLLELLLNGTLIDLKTLQGDHPVLEINIKLHKQNCIAGAGVSENTCETNPKRDCSCMEGRLAGMMDGFNAFIQPDTNGAEFEVFCSLMDGKLWTVIQQRTQYNGQSFNRTFQDYEDGFGLLAKDFWIGLKHISALTSAVNMSLMMEMYAQNHSSIIHIQYDHCKVEDASNDYKLTISGYRGNATEAVLEESNGRPFSARGHDAGGDGCPDTFQAGWWYAEGAGQCASCTPNGPFGSQSPVRMGCNGKTGDSVTLYLTPWDYLQDNAA